LGSTCVIRLTVSSSTTRPCEDSCRVQRIWYSIIIHKSLPTDAFPSPPSFTYQQSMAFPLTDKSTVSPRTSTKTQLAASADKTSRMSRHRADDAPLPHCVCLASKTASPAEWCRRPASHLLQQQPWNACFRSHISTHPSHHIPATSTWNEQRTGSVSQYHLRPNTSVQTDQSNNPSAPIPNASFPAISTTSIPPPVGHALYTRSQAVARIADRTAKNCRGHVTWATPTTFREIICAPARYSQYKAAYQIWSL